VFRSIAARQQPTDGAEENNPSPSNEELAAQAAARFDDAAGQHPLAAQPADPAPPRLLGSNLPWGGDPFVHLAAAQEEVSPSETESAPQAIQAPSAATEIGPSNNASPGFLPPGNAPPGQPPSGYQGAQGCDWPHGDLRSQFGEPLVGASWCSRPYQVGAFLGFMRATELISGKVDQNTGVIGGFRLGWDYDTYWGIEGRLAFASIQTETEASPVFDSADQVRYWDTSLLYYPWGDSRWRPYLTLGVGLTEFRYFDETMIKRQRGLLAVPIGGGLKYRMHDSWTLRFDVLDNIALGSAGLNTMNNFSFTSGVEYRFGGSHKNYGPWEQAGD
jgi:hypothetical protein